MAPDDTEVHMPLKVRDRGDDEKAVVLSAELFGISPAEVRRHLTEPGLITTWWAEEADTDPRPGGSYVLRWPSAGRELRGSYAMVDDDVVAFTWRWRDDEKPARQVTVALDGDDDATTVTIRHDYRGRSDREEIVAAWQHHLPRLAARAPRA